MTGGEDFLRIIRSRRSCRKYSNQPIEKEKLERIIEAGRMAPSACNAQPWKFIIVDDSILLQALAEAASAKLLGMNWFVNQAPIQIVVVRERPNITSRVGGSIKNKDYSLIDIGIASENICLQAEGDGLGSCILGWFDEERVKKILKIPKSKRVELIITIGYSLAEKKERGRKPPEETVSYNKY
jgi:nitroreductase